MTSRYFSSSSSNHSNRKLRAARPLRGALVIAVIFATWTFFLGGSTRSSDEMDLAQDRNLGTGRHLLWKKNAMTTNKTAKESSKKCNPPSIKEFPKDLFTNRQRKYGAIVLHFLISMYMFLALAFVCDDYFVASLDKICESLDLTEDVAGATFMAAGSSAPELFTSMIGVFVAHGDVGAGTIVGSAVFNILVILALVGLCAGQVTPLTRWPLFRDSSAYAIAVAALIGVMYDGKVAWYESLILLILYFGYCLLMKFNKTLLRLISKEPEAVEQQLPHVHHKIDINSHLMHNGRQHNYTNSTETLELVAKRSRRLTWREVGMMIMLTNRFTPATRLRAAYMIVTLRQDEAKQCLLSENTDDDLPGKNSEENESKSISEQQTEEDDEELEEVFATPDGSVFKIVYWYISLPIIALLHFTIPDCKRASWERWFILTFAFSIFWIAVFSFIMVWMVTIIGFTLGIPDVIMGISFLAAGTSIPDAIASLIVAKQGQGDMAVSNSIGSNVFDILIGLALPWFIKSAIIKPGSMIIVNSRGLIYSVMLLFASVFITILSIHINKWKLDRKIGSFFLVMYFIFLTISCLIEFNVFGFVNLPTCRS